MDKFKMDLTWHNCKTYPPKENYNAWLICTNGRDIDHCTYDKRYGFPFDESDLADFWWADLSQTVRNTPEFKEATQMNNNSKTSCSKWKPSEDEIFWHIDPFGNSVLDRWTGHSYHFTLYKLGNCYRTEVDSTRNRDKWIDFYASDEVMEV